MRRAPHPHVATLRRRTAGFLAPWDGPAAIVFADGRRVGALVDRNGLRPAAFSVTRDRLVAVASEAGAVPFAAAETVRRGRLGPGQLLLVEPGRHAILEDADAKHHVLRAAADPRRAAGRPRRSPRGRDPGPRRSAPRTRSATWPGSTPSAPGSTSRRWRSRGTSRCGAWATTRRRPAAPGVDRPVADHLRQAFAQVTNPAIDPERERIVMDLRVELGRRPPLLGGMPRAPRTVRLQRPIVADLDGLLGRASRARAPSIRVLDATWAAGDGSGRADRGARPARARRRRALARAGRRSCSSPIAPGRSTACRSRRSWRPARSTPR